MARRKRSTEASPVLCTWCSTPVEVLADRWSCPSCGVETLREPEPVCETLPDVPLEVIQPSAPVSAIAGLHSRTDARLVAPRARPFALRRREGLVIHCTAGRRPERPEDTAQILRNVQHYHMSPPRWVDQGNGKRRNMGGRGWPDVAYHWAVDPWGHVWQLRGWGVVGSHAKADGHNLKSHGVVLLGSGTEITEAERSAIRWMTGDAERRFGPQFVRPHCDLRGVTKRCPGDAVAAFVRSLGLG